MISAPLKDPITSYAQNFEDVLLWRALHDVGCGFYIDVGAQDPIFHSVSKGFYEKGWRGIHVEPTIRYAELLRADRPDELVLQAAVLDQSGVTQLYEIAETGMSTVCDDVADNAHREGWGARKISVPAVTLDEIFGTVTAPEIHWLKIDVEGAERAVIEGWREAPCRPWIILVEAIKPLSREQNYEDWEALLLAKGYRFVHFDSVNRYYVSHEHCDLASHFLVGPSMWDDLQVPAGSSLSRTLEQRHHEEVGRLCDDARNAQEALSEVKAQFELQLDHTRSEVLRVETELGNASNALTVAYRDIDTVERQRERAEDELDQTRLQHIAARQAALYEIDQLTRSFWWRCLSLLDREPASSLMKFVAALDPLHESAGRSVSSHKELLALPSATFVEQAFLILLNREVDEAGLAHFLSRAENGIDRDELLAEIRWSEEGRQLNPRLFGLGEGLRRGQRLKSRRARRMFWLGVLTGRRSPERSISTGDNDVGLLLAYDDEAFVRQAYRLVLGREPDPTGLATYVGRIRNGDEKIAILGSLLRSREGREAKRPLPGLGVRLFWHRLRHFPLLGAPLRFCEMLCKGPRVRRRIRAALNKAEILEGEMSNIHSLPLQPKLAEPTGTLPPVIAIEPRGAPHRAPRFRTDAPPPQIAAIRRLRWNIPPAPNSSSLLSLMRDKLTERLLIDAPDPNGGVSEMPVLSLLFDPEPSLQTPSSDSIYVVGEKSSSLTDDADDRSVKAIFCISNHAAKMIGDMGTGKPVHAVGYGFDQWATVPNSQNWDSKLPAQTFCFLHISSCDGASGFDLLVEAFCSAFSDTDAVCLVVRPRGGELQKIQSLIARISKTAQCKPNIILIAEELDDDELQSLLARSDVLVAPSRDGGFEPSIARALLAGTPAIVTAWGDHLDYCDAASCWLVDYVFERPKSNGLPNKPFWASPSLSELIDAMQAAFHSSPLDRARKAFSARALLREKFNWDTVADRLTTFATQALGAKPPLRLGWITTWNVKCGIASYSGHMLEQISSENVTVFAARDKDILQADKENCIRIWNSGKEKNGLNYVIQNMIGEPVDVIIISFNYGFFNFSELSDFINHATRMGISVIVELHSTVDPFGDTPNFRLAELAPALRRCSHVLVHGVGDMNRMKAVGVVDNVTLFPLGALDRSSYRAVAQDKELPPLLASFGFAYPNKGLLELVQAIGLLRDRKIDLRLLMLNAEGASDASRTLISEIRKAVEDLDLADRIELVTDYLEQDDCLKRLATADLIVNPYQHTGESASAAVRDAMATARPVLVTPLEIFDDLGAAVFRAKDVTPLAIADAIADTLTNLEKNSAAAIRVNEASKNWRETHDFRALSKRLMQLAVAAAQTERFAK